MPLSRECSMEAVAANIRQWLKEKADEARKSGRSREELQQQAIAVALSTLKKSCGVTSKARMTPKQIVAAGSVDEEAFGLAGPPKLYAPNRVSPSSGRSGMPVHRKARSGKEQPFINPEDFTVSVVSSAAATRPTSVAISVASSPTDGSCGEHSTKESIMGPFSNLMRAIREDKNREQDGAVRRDEFDQAPVVDVDFGDEERRLMFKAFILANTPEGHKFMMADGRQGFVYADERGRAVESAIEDLDDGELLWLAVGRGLKAEGMGMGRPGGKGLGPGGECICPSCGHVEHHMAGDACTDQACPKCGAAMTRSASEDVLVLGMEEAKAAKGSYFERGARPKVGDKVWFLAGQINQTPKQGTVVRVEQTYYGNHFYCDVETSDGVKRVSSDVMFDHKPKKVEREDKFGKTKVWECACGQDGPVLDERRKILPDKERERLEASIWDKIKEKRTRASGIMRVFLNDKLAEVAGLGRKGREVNLKDVADAMLIRIAKYLSIGGMKPAYSEDMETRSARYLAEMQHAMDAADESQDLLLAEQFGVAASMYSNAMAMAQFQEDEPDNNLVSGLKMVAYAYAQNASKAEDVDAGSTSAVVDSMTPAIASNLVRLLEQKAAEDHGHLSSIFLRATQEAAREVLGISGRPDRNGAKMVERATRELVASSDGRVARMSRMALRKLREATTFQDIGAAFQVFA